MRRTFYFNTGVTLPVKLSKGQVWKDGTVQIPFECENVPENAEFKFASNNLDSAPKCYLASEIVSGELGTKYAFFFIHPYDK